MSQSSNYSDANTIKGKIQVRSVKKIHIVDIENIIRCESSKNYTTIFLRNEKNIMASHTLKDFEQLLPSPMFLRVHQSHLINTNYIKQINRYDSLMLSDNSKIPIASRKHDLINDYLRSVPGV